MVSLLHCDAEAEIGFSERRVHIEAVLPERSHRAASMLATAALGWYECDAGSGASIEEKVWEKVLDGIRL